MFLPVDKFLFDKLTLTREGLGWVMASTAKSQATPPGPAKVRVIWTIASSLVVLMVIYLAVWTWNKYDQPHTTDFVSFWAAGKLALQLVPADAYNIPVHKALELSTGALKGGLMPFAYPPPFLFFVTPFATFPYNVALLLWVGVTGALYVYACARDAPLPYAFVHPAALINALIGQNGFLTSAIFIGGTWLLAARPALGGAVLGMLIIKPQLALLLPVALLAARKWRSLVAAAASALTLLLSALIAFGVSTYQAFVSMLPGFSELLRHGLMPWEELASLYAFCRFLGFAEWASFGIHAAVALAAAITTWRAWQFDFQLKVPILTASTVLVSPYIYTYDTLLLVLPMTHLMQQGTRPISITVMWVLCALPFASYADLWPGPNTAPLAAILAIYLMLQDTKLINGSRPAAMSN